MNKPICDFVSKYSQSDAMRLHMPGHKGRGGIAESFDITEITGADSLYEASGIIAESEKNASELFGAHTFYSAEGSSLSVRAMLYLVTLYAKSIGKAPAVAVARNAHKSFVSAAALLDIDVTWLTGNASYLSCVLSERDIRAYLGSAKALPVAVYITSPDYLGNMSDIRGIARACHENGVLLIVDNAHGAYLKLLTESEHPIDLGADMCCDSAHKTLSALTGSAYLHISYSAPKLFARKAKNALALFGSTSPSYLVLQSLDALNCKLAGDYKKRLSAITGAIKMLKSELIDSGYTLVGNEKMKLTVAPKFYGYTGYELAGYLLDNKIVCEFSDPDYVTLMPSVETSQAELQKLCAVLKALPKRKALTDTPPDVTVGKRVMSIREAVLSEDELLPVSECVGRIAASTSVGCPPAVPIVVPGEMVDDNAIKLMKYYNIKECSVVKE